MHDVGNMVMTVTMISLHTGVVWPSVDDGRAGETLSGAADAPVPVLPHGAGGVRQDQEVEAPRLPRLRLQRGRHRRHPLRVRYPQRRPGTTGRLPVGLRGRRGLGPVQKAQVTHFSSPVCTFFTDSCYVLRKRSVLVLRCTFV